MNKAILDRLVYCEETYAGESETWRDPVTGDYYYVRMEQLDSAKAYSSPVWVN